MNRSQALFLFAHGSRDPLWRVPIEAVAAHLKALLPDTHVGCAYLELCEPSLEAACEALLQTCPTLEKLTIFPMFLGMGKHARADLPMLVQALQDRHPHLEIEVMPPLGEYPELAQTVASLVRATSGDGVRINPAGSPATKRPGMPH